MKQPVSPTQKVLNVWAIILIVWSIYRAYFRTDLPVWFDEFVAKPLVFILPVYFYITNIEKKDFFSGVDLKFNKIGTDIIWGLGIGLFFFLTGLAGHFVKAQGFSLPSNAVMIPGLLSIIIISLATSFSEEVVSRGFVLNRLYGESKNAFTSVFLASILFFFLHIPILLTNDKIIGFTLIQVMVTDLIFSIGVSFIYLERRSLLLTILIHACYSVSIYMFM